jgi:hypothetical protein
MRFSGILVRLEINAVIQFQSKFDGQNLKHSKVENVLANQAWATTYVYGTDSKCIN